MHDHEAARALVLSGGAEIHIRPLRTGDRATVAALFARLSDESRYRRYLVPKRELSAGELECLAGVDHAGHEALTAVDARDGSIAGIARYVEYAGRPGVAELAIEVADPLQGRGIGSALTARLVERARAHGLHLLAATTLRENLGAKRVLGRVGFEVRGGGHGREIDLELRLR
jgi:RimJ/RimL family protein N-acetyltransferase